MSRKRFVKDHSYLIDYDKYCIFDKVQHKHLYLDEVIDLLNELSEEKEYFERKKEYFLSKWSIANAENIQLKQENRELKKENEQLKQK